MTNVAIEQVELRVKKVIAKSCIKILYGRVLKYGWRISGCDATLSNIVIEIQNHPANKVYVKLPK